MGNRGSARELVLGLLLSVGAGCLNAPTELCADGRICPGGTQCHSTGMCVTAGQIAACDGLGDGLDCVTGGIGGTCVDGACIARGCGDGVAMDTEECDGQDLGMFADCHALGYYGDGELSCTDRCIYDTSACTGGICGDGIINGDEQCDGAQLGAATGCKDLEYYDDGSISCTTLCRYDDRECTGFCGDSMVNGNELCDGSIPIELGCADFGWDVGPLTCLALCAPRLDDCIALDWQHENLGAAHRGVHAFPTGEHIVVGSAQYSYHFDGTSYAAVAQPSGAISRRDVWGAAPDDLWAVGTDPGQPITHYDGAAWSLVSPQPGAQLQGVWGAAADDVWAVGGGGMIAHYDGTDWAEVPSAQRPTARNLFAIEGAADDDIWAVGGGVILHYDGTDWTEVTPAPTGARLNALWIGSAYEVVAAGEGVALRYDGTSWQPMPVPAGFQAQAVMGWDLQHLFAGGLQDEHYYDGISWHSMGNAADIYAGVSPEPGELLAFGSAGAMLALPGATQWEGPVLDPTDRGWMIDPGFIIAPRCCGTARIYEDGNWSLKTISAGLTNLVGAWGYSRDDYFVIDAQDQIYHCIDGVCDAGTTAPSAGTLHAIHGVGPSYAVAVGTGGSISVWNGTGWATHSSPTSVGLWDVRVFGVGDFVVAGIEGAFRWSGGQWTALGTVQPFRALFAIAPDEIVGVGDAGVWRWDGTTWIEQETPGTAFTAIAGTGPRDIFATSAYDIVHFDGSRWSRVRSLLANVLRDVLVSPRRIVIAASSGAEQELQRHRPWSCQASEHSCGDGVDEDCDGLYDYLDDDCTGAYAITELLGDAAGDSYVELTNRGGGAGNASGLEIAWRSSCDAGQLHRHRLDHHLIVRPGEPARIVDGADALQHRERYTPDEICDEPSAATWVALCSGPCDLQTCDNVLDYLEKSPSQAAVPSPPACASFDSPVDTSSLTPGHSIQRSAFTTNGPNGVAGDWTSGPPTRD